MNRAGLLILVLDYYDEYSTNEPLDHVSKRLLKARLYAQTALHDSRKFEPRSGQPFPSNFT